MTRARLSVTPAGSARWRVEVHGSTSTSHLVTVPVAYVESLGLADLPPERVIEESFRFLLEREPNTSILREFSLPLIETYFPEYPAEIRTRLH